MNQHLMATAIQSKGRWKTYPVYKKSGIEWLGSIPCGWDRGRIVWFSELMTGGTPDRENPDYWVNGTINWMNSGEVNKRIISIVDGKITEAGMLNSNASLLPINSVMLALNGQGKTKGMSAILKVPSTCNQSLAAFICNESRLHHRYLHYYLESRYPDIRGLVGEQRDGLSLGLLKEISIYLPPIDEQKAIADFLDRETAKIDALIAKKERLIELLEEERSALISRAVTKGLDPKAQRKDSGVEWLGEIPRDWEIKKLKFLAKEPLKYGANEVAESIDSDCPRFIRITDVDTSGKLKEGTFRSLHEEVARPYLLQRGDILFARSGATVGKTFLYHESWGRACHAGYLIRLRTDERKVLPEFIAQFSASSSYWEWISGNFIQATIQNVSAERYANLKIGLPPLSEQRAIVASLDMQNKKTNGLIAKINRHIEKLQEYRTALISSAVAGEIDVRGEDP